MLLTNGVAWNLYHLTFDQGIEAELAFAVEVAQPEAAGLIANLHRNAIRKGELEAYWSKHSALSPASIGHALFHENVLRPLRRQIRKDTRLLIDPEDLAGELHKMFSPEAREQIETPEHVAELVAFKRAARHHRGLDRLHHAGAHTAAFFAAVAAVCLDAGGGRVIEHSYAVQRQVAAVVDAAAARRGTA